MGGEGGERGGGERVYVLDLDLDLGGLRCVEETGILIAGILVEGWPYVRTHART